MCSEGACSVVQRDFHAFKYDRMENDFSNCTTRATAFAVVVLEKNASLSAVVGAEPRIFEDVAKEVLHSFFVSNFSVHPFPRDELVVSIHDTNLSPFYTWHSGIVDCINNPAPCWLPRHSLHCSRPHALQRQEPDFGRGQEAPCQRICYNVLYPAR